MKHTKFAATAAAFALAPMAIAPEPAHAQSAQQALDARYDRALAAGYKALFLCSAIANAEANGASRTPESVHAWELTGIQSPLDAIIREMKYEIMRRPTGQIAHVQVEWADDMPDRVATYYGADTGCSVMPIGSPENLFNAEMPLAAPQQSETPVDEASTRIDLSASALGLSEVRVKGPENRALLDPVMKAFGVADDSAAYGKGTRTTAVVVRVMDGEGIKSELSAYAADFSAQTPQRTWSVAKSIASTLVGMAVNSREHSTDDPIGLNFWRTGGRADARNAITIDHALRMATGRYSDTAGNRTDPIYWGGTTIDENMTKWPVIHKPGTVYRYANNDTLLAIKGVEQYLDFYTVPALLGKIGMQSTVVETDWKGGYVLSSQVWATAPDLATLGELYLKDGVIAGEDGPERVLPENWRDYVSSPSGPQPEGRPFGYGAGWWLLNQSDGVPPDTFAAFGNRGQYVVVVPSRSAVIVRRGEDMVGTRFDIAAFTRDVLAQLD